MQTKLFKKSSTTYFNSTLFFEKEVREKIIILYGFVRYADNIVDKKNASIRAFEKFEKEYKTKKTNNKIILDFIKLKEQNSFKEAWVEEFLKAMKQDFKKKEYLTIEETKKYCHGSAEVIGLMIAKILGLEETSYPYAKKLGLSMQYINMIRDVAEDNKLGRIYLPKKEMQKLGLNSLDHIYAIKNKKAFNIFIRSQIKQYFKWLKEAKKGFKYIPKNNLVAIKTASDMYEWTASKIYENPLLIFKKKIKPSKLRVIYTAIKNKVIL